MFVVKNNFFVSRGLIICTVYPKKVPQSDYICMLLLPFLDLLTSVSVFEGLHGAVLSISGRVVETKPQTGRVADTQFASAVVHLLAHI